MRKLRQWLCGISACALLALTLGGCGAAPEPRTTRTFVYGLTLPPSGIDPHINASAELGIALRSVYDTLVYRDAQTGNFVPGLASSWQVSPDGLTYIFLLRKAVKFHDGTPFDADAVRITLQRILDPANGSAKARQLLGPVKDIQVQDKYTISIVLTKPFAPLLDGLSQPYVGIASPQALARTDKSTYQFHQVGTGPYKFVEYVVNDRLVLQKNPDYVWGPSVVANPGVPAVETIIFRFYPDPASRTLALESGDAQVMGELLPADAQKLTDEHKIQLQPVPIPGQPLQFIFNINRVPTNSLAARQALILATDRQALVQAVFRSYSPIAYGPLSASTLYYEPSVQGRYSYDPVHAVALFNSTGWTDSDGDGWRDDKGKPIELSMVIPPWGLIPDVAQLLQDQWQTVLKIKVHVKQVASFPMLSDEAKADNYNAIALNFFGLDPIVLDDFYRSDGVRNWSHVADPQLDEMLSTAEQSMDPQERKQLYSKIQTRIMDQALILPIRDYVNLNGYEIGIEGLRFDSQGWFPYLTDLGFGS